MYERFYGFKERPFSLLPDPDFLFLGDKHKTALDLLELTIFNQAGFCVVSGDIGAGKTTLIRELLNRLDEDICVGLISNTHSSFGELLQWIMAAFGLTCDSCDQFELHKRFLDFVIQQYAENKRTLLIIDEAQNLSVSAMEELRMLSNVNSDSDLLLQVIVVGQHQLRDKLQLPELEQFAQRIAVYYHLTGLDEKETHDYIQYRVTHAGGSPDLFSKDSCRTIYRCSDGVPRLINGICDTCLVYGYSDKSPVITPALVRDVINDQLNGYSCTPASKFSQRAGDAVITDAGSTPAAGARVIEHDTTTRPEAESAGADGLAGHIPDLQQETAELEDAAPEDTAVAAEVTTGLASFDTAPETIVGSRETMVLQEAIKSRAEEPIEQIVSGNDSAGLSGLHRFVVEAERGAGGVHKLGAPAVSRLIMGLVLLTGAGVTGWLAWLVWDETPVAETVESRSSESAVPSMTVNVPVIDPLKENTNKRSAQREVERLEREKREAEKRLAELREAERLERERLDAEKRLVAQREAERLARLRQEAERRLAEQRQAERLERERLEAEKRQVAQREAARLARIKREAGRELAKRREAIRQAKKAGNTAPQRIFHSLPKRTDRPMWDSELEAKRAAARAAWEKAGGGGGTD